jgi:hypothetical protein
MPAAPDAPPAITPEAWGIVLQLREARAARLEALQAVVDGAVLAVEQVQDVRIDLLEKGPEVLVEDIVFDVLLGLAMGKVADALKTCTASIAQQLADSAVDFAGAARHPKAAALLGAGIKASDAERFDKIFRTASRGPSPVIKAADIKRYNGAIREFVAERIGKALDVAAEKSLGIVEKGLPKSAARNVDLEDTDSPAVSMLSAAEAYVSAQRYAQDVFHATMEVVVLGGSLDKAELKSISQNIAIRKLEASYNEIRDRHKMLFEAALWCRLFHIERPSRLGSTWFLSRKSGHLDLGGAPAPLLRYWCHRFARCIAKVIQGDYRTLQGTEAEKQRRATTPYEQLDIRDQESLLRQFFEMVGSDFDEALRQTRTPIDACGFTNTTPVVPKT